MNRAMKWLDDIVQDEAVYSKEIGEVLFQVASGRTYASEISNELKKGISTVAKQLRLLEELQLIKKSKRDKAVHYEPGWENFYYYFISHLISGNHEFDDSDPDELIDVFSKKTSLKKFVISYLQEIYKDKKNEKALKELEFDDQISLIIEEFIDDISFLNIPYLNKFVDPSEKTNSMIKEISQFKELIRKLKQQKDEATLTEQMARIIRKAT